MTTHDESSLCQCDETIIDDIDPSTGRIISRRRLTIIPFEHNCYYVALRNALIPRAEWEAIQAEREHARTEHRPFSDHHVSSIFSRRMEFLVARANREAAQQVSTPGPERNRAFFTAMKRLANERL